MSTMPITDLAPEELTTEIARLTALKTNGAKTVARRFKSAVKSYLPLIEMIAPSTSFHNCRIDRSELKAALESGFGTSAADKESSKRLLSILSQREFRFYRRTGLLDHHEAAGRSLISLPNGDGFVQGDHDSIGIKGNYYNSQYGVWDTIEGRATVSPSARLKLYLPQLHDKLKAELAKQVARDARRVAKSDHSPLSADTTQTAETLEAVKLLMNGDAARNLRPIVDVLSEQEAARWQYRNVVEEANSQILHLNGRAAALATRHNAARGAQLLATAQAGAKTAIAHVLPVRPAGRASVGNSSGLRLGEAS